jgi:hypothetical protein
MARMSRAHPVARRLALPVAVSLGLAMVLAVLPRTTRAGELAWWKVVEVQRSVAEALTVRLVWRDEAPRFARLGRFHLEPAVAWRPASWLELAAMYRLQRAANAGTWVTEHRPEVALGFHSQRWTFEFAHRDRFEYSAFSDGRRRWRIASLTHISRDVDPGGVVFRPWIRSEWFLDLERGAIEKNEASVGLARRLDRHFTVQLFGVLISRKRGDGWRYGGALGTGVIIDL